MRYKGCRYSSTKSTELLSGAGSSKPAERRVKVCCVRPGLHRGKIQGTERQGKQTTVVCLLSSDHGNTAAPSGKTNKDGESVIKPSCVLDDNRHVGGVDQMDQQLESLPVVRRSYKW